MYPKQSADEKLVSQLEYNYQIALQLCSENVNNPLKYGPIIGPNTNSQF